MCRPTLTLQKIYLPIMVIFYTVPFSILSCVLDGNDSIFRGSRRFEVELNNIDRYAASYAASHACLYWNFDTNVSKQQEHASPREVVGSYYIFMKHIGCRKKLPWFRNCLFRRNWSEIVSLDHQQFCVKWSELKTAMVINEKHMQYVLKSTCILSKIIFIQVFYSNKMISMLSCVCNGAS